MYVWFFSIHSFFIKCRVSFCIFSVKYLCKLFKCCDFYESCILLVEMEMLQLSFRVDGGLVRVCFEMYRIHNVAAGMVVKIEVGFLCFACCISKTYF
ncbi:unnamed protein product [Cuscuta campestris]|uniref:Uncharacterized protein n=1 Tax=Cuscuta campestris TaxID=132261 RepID=A0A484L503_9ASTE|nr:unnamed protein product [Cuscuta campestris]